MRETPKTLRGGLGRIAAALASFALLVLLPCGSRAASSATVDIDVTVNASISVNVDASALASSTYSVSATPGVAVLAPSTATVSSDAIGILERWRLSAADAYDQVTAGTGWTLVTSTSGAGAPATDQYAIQAIFVSSNAAAGDCSAAVPATAWNQAYATPLSAAGSAYNSTSLADATVIGGATGTPDFTSPPGSDGRMRPGSKRALCWRLVPPAAVTNSDAQTIAVTITATAP